MYPLTAKELVVECEKWLPNQTAEQQKKKTSRIRQHSIDPNAFSSKIHDETH